MKLKNLIYNFASKLLYPVFYIGKWDKNTIVYNISNNTKFKLRVNTSDKLILLEVWKTKTYIDKNFNIKKNDVVVDIGANIGAFSVLAAKKATNGRIFSYEPDKGNYSLLLKNKDLNNLHNIFAFNLALAGKKGHIDFFISKLNCSSHSIYSTDSENSIKVKSIILKDIFAMNNLRRINYLKIDVEGAEYDILLRTPAKVIKRVDKIVLEYHDNLKHGFSYIDSDHGYSYIDLKNYLEDNGFKVKITGNVLLRKVFGVGIIKARR